MLKRDRNDNPELDKELKIAELRALYKAMSERSGTEDVGNGSGDSVSDKVSAYFEWEKTRMD